MGCSPLPSCRRALEESCDYLREQDVLVEQDRALRDLPARVGVATQNVVARADERHLLVAQVVQVDEEAAVHLDLVATILRDANVRDDVADAREGLLRP